MRNYIKKRLGYEIIASLIIFLAFLLGIFIFNHAPFTGLDFILIYAMPILVYSLFIKIRPLKEQLLLNLTRSLWIALPVSLGIGWFIGTPDNHDAAIIRSFDYGVFLLITIVFLKVLFVITYITLLLGHYLKTTFVKKISIEFT